MRARGPGADAPVAPSHAGVTPGDHSEGNSKRELPMPASTRLSFLLAMTLPSAAGAQHVPTGIAGPQPSEVRGVVARGPLRAAARTRFSAAGDSPHPLEKGRAHRWGGDRARIRPVGRWLVP
jgi:hypothetical protein